MTTRWDTSQPIYLQLQHQIESQIIDGTIVEGALLPSIRQVSIDYQLNPLTVSKVYHGLVERGLIEKERGVGMRVLSGAQNKLFKAQKNNFLKNEWPKLNKKLKQLNINIQDLLNE